MRRLLSVLAVTFTLAATGPASALAAATPAPAAASVAANASILMYHHIAIPPKSLTPADSQYFVDPASFEQQIYYLLAHGFSIVSLDRVVQTLTSGPALPPKPVAITVDDGWQDFWQNGLPIVEKYKVPVTLFAIADADKGGYMNPSERWVLAHSGVQIAAHTLTHPHLTRLLPAAANEQIVNSRKNLEKEIALPVQLFAYPYGDFNAPVEAMVRAAGYSAAFAAGPAPDENAAHLFGLPRVMVSHYDTLSTFAQKAADYRWARTHVTPLPAPPPAPVAPVQFAPAPIAGTPAPTATPEPDADISVTRLLNNVPDDAPAVDPLVQEQQAG